MQDNYEDLEKVIIDGRMKETMAALGRMEKEGLNEHYAASPVTKVPKRRQRSMTRFVEKQTSVELNSTDSGENDSDKSAKAIRKSKTNIFRIRKDGTKTATRTGSNAVPSADRRSEEKSSERRGRMTLIMREKEKKDYGS